MKKVWHQNFAKKPAYLRTSPDGIIHDSVEEMQRWCSLLFEQKIGEIRNLKRQVRYPLDFGDGRAVKTPTGRIAIYTCDFAYERKSGNVWSEIIEDHKGFSDRLSEFRIAVFEAIYQKKVYMHKR